MNWDELKKWLLNLKEWLLNLYEEYLLQLYRKGKRCIVQKMDKKKLWTIALAISIICIFCVFSKDGIALWKKANVSPSEREEERIYNSNIEKEKRPKKEAKAESPPVIDMSDNYVEIKTDMQRINEPTYFDNEVIYSAGEGSNIEDQAILTKLFVYDMETKEEKVIAESGIKFGEIYEGRLSHNWVAWLDTNHIGTNIIYGMNRESGEIVEVKKCEYNRPQIRLWEDNLIWVEQRDLENDSLYLYNFSSGEPVVLESFDNPTYGTCPPCIWENVIVWVSPREGEGSIIKKLALNEKGDSSAGGPEPELIDPKGFAIYPATNGEVIAWLDNLDPNEASLKLTLDGNNIVTVANGVGRFFGVGDRFVAYTQAGTIMLYFWNEDTYAYITPKDVLGRLSQCSVSGNYITWYSNPPKEKQDIVNITIIK